MTEFEATGGGQIGLITGTWPFFKLRATANRLEINASFSKYIFAPDDIISIEGSGGLKPGIRVIHNVPGYSKRIEFSGKNNYAVLEGMNQIGFKIGKAIPDIEKLEIVQMQKTGGFSFNIKPAIAVVVIWNLCFIGGMIKEGMNGLSRLPTQCATGFMFLVALGILTSQPVAELFLKPGRTVKDVRNLLLFIMLICGFMFIMFTLIPFGKVR